MHRVGLYFFFLLFFFRFQIIQSQEINSAPDTVYVADTIVNNRVVEKVVYVYRFPSNYTGVGFLVKSEIGINAPDSISNIDSYSYGGGINLQFHRKMFISELGLFFSSRTTSFDYAFNVKYSFPGTYTKIDTIAKYYETINNITIPRFITKESIRDTIYNLIKDSLVNYTNKYKIIQVPILLGIQKAIHFFNIECKAGLIPSYIIYPDKNNTILNQPNSSIPEDGYLNRFGCDLLLGVGLKYLLTVNTMLQADLYYQRQLTNTYDSNYWNPQPQSVALSIGFTYMLNEKE